MFNNYLAEEEMKERIKQRIQEAETYSLRKQLGYSDSARLRWIFVSLIVVALVVVGLLI
jgi:F0F1-type ATP synthase assembly protein I